jgi:hypothetical protein
VITDSVLVQWIKDLTAGAGDLAPSIVEALWEREKGGNSGTVAHRPREVGSRGKRWNTVLKGMLITLIFFDIIIVIICQKCRRLTLISILQPL